MSEVMSKATGAANAIAGRKGFQAFHGAAANGKKSLTYMSWSAMRSRCLTKTNDRYQYYGGRGITVCERWANYENFLADMGERPSKLHTLDRINNDGNYEPGNCRWATKKEQRANQRTPAFYRFIDISGQRFGSLTALRIHSRDNRDGVRWICRCDCGGEKVSAAGQLRSGYVLSCGCMPTGRKPFSLARGEGGGL